MQINLGSKNPNKCQALVEVASDFIELQSSQVNCVYVESGVSDQPLSMAETILGAKNRAANAFQDCQLSIGIEGGLVQFPDLSDYFQIAICAIYDGVDFELGFSSALHVPDKITDYITEHNCDLEEALFSLKLTEDERIGKKQGVVGLITNGRLNRKEYLKEAYLAAFSSYFYGKSIL